MKRLTTFVIVVLTAGLCFAQPPRVRKAIERLKREAVVEFNVMVPTRDDTKLAIDVLRPKGPGKHPTVFSFTPYGKNVLHSIRMVRDGYAVVSGDVRGTGRSEGAFYPFKGDGEDACDTIEWLAKRSWCNGKIGMVGGSYVGFTQLAAALERPPHLRCIMPAVPPVAFGGRTMFNGGALRQELAQGWLLGQSWNSQRVRRKEVPEKELERWRPVRKFSKWQMHLPLNEPGPIAIGGASYAECWRDTITFWESPGHWDDISPLQNADRINVPTLMLGGFYDIFTQENIEMLLAIRRKGGAGARKHSHLLLGPWCHGIGGKTGDVNFSKARSALRNLRKRWLARWLKGEKSDVDDWPPLKVFTMGQGRWTSMETWPPPQAEPTKIFLTGGKLSFEPPGADGGSTSFTYDPEDPVRTISGNNLLLRKGIRDNSSTAERRDVLTFVGPQLKDDEIIAGRIRAHLFVSSSAPDTDFTAMLVDVHPDGYAANVQDGIVRLRYRNGRDRPRLVPPGEIVAVDIDLWSTAYTFKKGHRPALYVSSSNFPRFDRHMNTAESPADWSKAQKAENTVYHDAEHQSFVEVPRLK